MKSILFIIIILSLAGCATNTLDVVERDTASVTNTKVDLKLSLNDKKNELLIVHPSGKNLDLKLNIPKDFSYESHSVQKFDSIFFIIYSYTDVSVAGSEIVAIDAKNIKEVWRRRVSSFNVSIPLVQKGYAYVSAMGQFTKLNLKTGKAMWHNENLIGEREVSGTEEVQKEGDTIKLSEKVKFSDKTGNLLSMDGL